jgi:hypothetical protein
MVVVCSVNGDVGCVCMLVLVVQLHLSASTGARRVVWCWHGSERAVCIERVVTDAADMQGAAGDLSYRCVNLSQMTANGLNARGCRPVDEPVSESSTAAALHCRHNCTCLTPSSEDYFTDTARGICSSCSVLLAGVVCHLQLAAGRGPRGPGPQGMVRHSNQTSQQSMQLHLPPTP